MIINLTWCLILCGVHNTNIAKGHLAILNGSTTHCSREAAPQNGCSQIVIYTDSPTSPNRISAKLKSTKDKVLQKWKGGLSHMVQVGAKICSVVMTPKDPIPISLEFSLKQAQSSYAERPCSNWSLGSALSLFLSLCATHAICWETCPHMLEQSLKILV